MVDTDILTAMNQEVVSRLPKLSVSDVSDAVFYALSTPDTVRVRFLIKEKLFNFNFLVNL